MPLYSKYLKARERLNARNGDMAAGAGSRYDADVVGVVVEENDDVGIVDDRRVDGSRWVTIDDGVVVVSICVNAAIDK